MANGAGDFGIQTGQQGAWYIAEHLVRKVKIYPMTESELESMQLLNSIASTALSVAAFLAGIYASIWWDVKTAGDRATRTLGDPILDVLAYGALVCVVVALWAKWSKGGTFDRMVRESFVIREGQTVPLAPRSGFRARMLLAFNALRGKGA